MSRDANRLQKRHDSHDAKFEKLGSSIEAFRRNARRSKVKVNDETTEINEMSRCLANIAKLEVCHDMNLDFLTHFIRKQDSTLKEMFKCMTSMTRFLKASHESNERRLANLETMLQIDVSDSIAVSVDSDKSGESS